MKKVTLYNSFHHTFCVILVPEEGTRVISQKQVKAIKRKLCGHKDCCCSGELGVRSGDAYDQDQPKTRIGTRQLTNPWGSIEVWMG